MFTGRSLRGNCQNEVEKRTDLATIMVEYKDCGKSMTKITMWPLETSYDADELISKYTEFQEQSRSILGKNTSMTSFIK